MYYIDPYSEDGFEDDDCCGDCGSPFDSVGWCPLCDYDWEEDSEQWTPANADRLFVEEMLQEDDNV